MLKRFPVIVVVAAMVALIAGVVSRRCHRSWFDPNENPTNLKQILKKIPNLNDDEEVDSPRSGI